MKVTFRNDFHNTSVTLVIKNGTITKGQVQRARRELCGIKDCKCGGELGQRGSQGFHYDLSPLYYGGYKIITF